jgi:hypothetical protein
MPTVENIVLADAQGTPVNHTFNPLGFDANGVMWWEDRSQPTPDGYWRISAQLVRLPPPTNGLVSSANRVNRVKIGLHKPVLEVVGVNSAGYQTAPTVAYVDRSNEEFIFSSRDSLQDRKDVRKMKANLLADANFITFIEQLENWRN